MRSTWIFLFTMLLGLTACDRPNNSPAKTPVNEAPVNKAPASQPEIASTEAKVLAVANAVATAAENKDIKGIMAAMTKDVRISAITAGGAREYTYDTYEAYITTAFPQISAYKYKRSNESVKQVGDDIVFSFLVNETYVVQGKNISETHQETWSLRPGATGLQIYKILITQ